jgi:hypothetical protein
VKASLVAAGGAVDSWQAIDSSAAADKRNDELRATSDKAMRTAHSLNIGAEKIR